MKLPIQVVFRDVLALPWLEEDIRRRAEKLEQFTPHLMSCHVVVESLGHHHQQGRRYVVKIDLRVPGAEIFAGEHHANEDVGIAVRGAFDAVRRRLEDFERRRRGQVKRKPWAAQARQDALTEPVPPTDSDTAKQSLMSTDSDMSNKPEALEPDVLFVPDATNVPSSGSSHETRGDGKGSALS
jgi:ribosome-associated translation inhibitor RaiA